MASIQQSRLSPSEVSVLNNPVWYALSTDQSRLAEGSELAKRFSSDIAPLGALKEQSAEAYAALQELTSVEPVALFLDSEPVPPVGWTMVHRDMMYQMVCEAPIRGASIHEASVSETSLAADDSAALRRLTLADIPQMLELTKLTEPGPFRPRTIELGSYFGIFHSGALVAMTGERLHPAGFTEVSAVCTHPDYRGRKYGNILVNTVTARILRRGETPFLHVRTSNPAVHLYEKLGFTTRTQLHLAVVKYGTDSITL
jgi:GNAT superfamily N-acetyltransferase